MMDLGLYIHIPFCRRKCNYCDFLSFADNNNHKKYMDALNKELLLYQKFLSSCEINSVFIGGGTPSIVDELLIQKLFENIKVTDDAEITIEVNPGTCNKNKLDFYKKIGINRLSIGLQSAVDSELKLLGRIHNYNDFINTYKKALEAGFENINVDVMFGIPNQTYESFLYTLNNVKNLDPTHISCYSLIIEENTPFAKMKIKLPDEETERKMYENTPLILNGYNRYEISNYSKKGYECKHNIKYWTLKNYLGLGLGAHSFINNNRFFNTSDIGEYVSMIEHEKLPVKESYSEDSKELLTDYIITGLRLTEGINIDELNNKFSVNFFRDYKKITDKYIGNGLLIFNEGQLKFSKRGLSVSNYVLSDFV